MDKRYFERFYEEYADRIFRFVFYRVNGDRDLARDVTQDVFLKAFQAFERYDPEISRSAWIYTITRNHLAHLYAKQRSSVELAEIEDNVWFSEDGREQYAVEESERSLLAAINRLGADEAMLIRMKYLEGWSFSELAEHFKKTSGSLRVQANRAMKKLKYELTKDKN